MKSEVESSSWRAGMPRRDWRNQWHLIGWIFAWMLSFVGASALLRFGWVGGSAGYLVALLPNLLGVATFWSFLRFLREADELQRKIRLEALGWGFGCGAVFMVGYQLLERAGFPPIDTADPLVVMSFAWAMATLVLTRRYS